MHKRTNTVVVALADRPTDRDLASAHVYDAECALHAARQSHVDEWITSASERLHEAISAYLAAVAT